jgi:hypothetical protein
MSSPAAVSEIVVPIACRLCSRKFTPPAGVDLGDTPDARTARFVMKLSTHLRETHPNEFKAAALQGQEYGGMLMLRYFGVNGDVRHQADQTRWKIHQATAAIHVSDERIVTRVTELFSATHTAAELRASFSGDGLGLKIVRLLQEMRDILTEAGGPPKLS